MATFAKLSVWPIGYFRAYSSWLLKNRRDVTRRVDAINAEIARIGEVKVYYAEEIANGDIRKTEQRTGIYVTPGSSLGRLFQAYIAMGGDPLSISPFAYPDSTARTEENSDGVAKIQESYPYGGLAAPQSTEPNMPIANDDVPGWEAYQGGFVPMAGYYPARQGGRIDPGAYDHNAVVRSMHQMRSWANQDIKERFQDLEWRIIKLCDLREQLIQERDEVLVQAFGSALSGLEPLNQEIFAENLLVQNLIQDMYQLLYPTDATGRVISFSENPDTTVFLPFTFPDDASEVGRDMLGS